MLVDLLLLGLLPLNQQLLNERCWPSNRNSSANANTASQEDGNNPTILKIYRASTCARPSSLIKEELTRTAFGNWISISSNESTRCDWNVKVEGCLWKPSECS